MALPVTLQNALALIQAGPVEVMIDPAGEALPIYVKDGVELAFAKGQFEVTHDIVGIYDIRTGGDGATFTLNVMEHSANLLGLLFGTHGLRNSGSGYYGFGISAGKSLRADAKQIRIRPFQTRGVTTVQVIFWVCIPTGDLTFNEAADDAWQWSQEFRALPDVTQADGELIAQVYAGTRGV